MGLKDRLCILLSLCVILHGWHTTNFFPRKKFRNVNCKTNLGQLFGTFDSYELDSRCDKIDKKTDVYETFSTLDQILFHRFGASVANEMNLSNEFAPKSYSGLISMISTMVHSQSVSEAHDKGKNILVKLFPSWLLKQYIVLFSRPFPAFSARMNAWVTHWTTNWLMGNSTVYDIEGANGEVEIQQGLLVERCRFLEESKCLATCLHACKIPTQRFFLESMGLPVTLLPNVTDYSCKFEFGHMPVPLEQDPIVKQGCLSICPIGRANTHNPTCVSV